MPETIIGESENRIRELSVSEQEVVAGGGLPTTTTRPDAPDCTCNVYGAGAAAAGAAAAGGGK
jgi:hypothetical protein